jgi:hypothetical protein
MNSKLQSKETKRSIAKSELSAKPELPMLDLQSLEIELLSDQDGKIMNAYVDTIARQRAKYRKLGNAHASFELVEQLRVIDGTLKALEEFALSYRARIEKLGEKRNEA